MRTSIEIQMVFTPDVTDIWQFIQSETKMMAAEMPRWLDDGGPAIGDDQ